MPALLLRAQAGDDAAFAALSREHRSLMHQITSKYYAPGLDRSDLEQEALVGLSNAVRDFRPDRKVAFAGFARMCIERQVITAVKAATRQKHGALNGSVSLDAPISTDGEGATLGEILEGPRESADPAGHLLAMEEISEMAGAVEGFTDLERDVWKLSVDGLSYEEIASRLGVDSKTVDNALQRVKGKFADAGPRAAISARRAGPQSVESLIEAAVGGVDNPRPASLARQLVPELKEDQLRSLAEEALARMIGSVIRRERMSSEPQAPRQSARWAEVARVAEAGDLDIARIVVGVGNEMKPLLDCMYLDLVRGSDRLRHLSEALLEDDNARIVRDLPEDLVRRIFCA